MKKNLQTLLIAILLCSFNAKGNHILGSDGRYKYLGKDTFLLTLDIYRDCKGTNLSPIKINVIGVGFSYTYTFTMTQINCGDVTPVCKKSCSKCDRSSCNAYGYPNGSDPTCSFPYGIEKITFQDTFIFSDTLSNSKCKFRIEFSQCCRSGALTTCCSGDNLYNYMELNRCYNNSSPIYHANPINIFCVGNCIAMNISGADTTDNDSISYHLAPALTSFGNSCTYQGSYTYQYPLYYDGFPNTKKFVDSTCKGFMLDSINGVIKCKPMQQQYLQIVVDVKEWRYDSASNKKINIGVTRRDFPVIIIANCTNKPPSLPSASQVGCAGDLICFNGIKSSDPDSKDTVKLTWNKGISKGKFTAKYNGSKKQEFDFCWQTDSSDASATPYYFTVTATDDACPAAGSFTRSYSITVKQKPFAKYTANYIGCGKVRFQAQPLQPNNIYNGKEIYTWECPYPNGKTIRDTAKNGIFDTIQKMPYPDYVKYKCSIEFGGCIKDYLDSVLVDTFLRASLNWDSACKGSITTIKATPINAVAPIMYTWNGQSSNVDSIGFLLTKDTIIYFSINDSLGCRFDDSLYIKALPNAKYNFVKNRYHYTFIPVVQNYSTYLWNFGDGDTSSQITPYHTYKTKGMFAVKLEVTNAKGCKDIYIDSVKADSMPTVSWTWNNACKGSIATLKASIAFSTAPIVYMWNGKKGSSNLYFMLTKDTLIYLKVTDGSGYVFYDSMYIKAEAQIKFQTTKQLNNYIFTPDVQYYPTYYWQFGDSAKSFKVIPNHAYTKKGTYVVKLEVISQYSCYAIYIDTVIVDSLPDVLMTADNYCIGKTTIVHAKVKNSTAPRSYTWNGQSSSVDSIYFTLTNDTMIYLQVKDSNGFYYNDSMFIVAEPKTNFQISNIANYYTFTPLVKNYPYYFWNFGDGDSSMQTIPTHIYNSNGSYLVKLIVQSATACADSLVQTIAVNTAINNIPAISNVKLYPNPTGSYSILEYNYNNKNSIKVYDITGKELQNIIKSNTTNNQTILYPPAKGIYIINILSESANYTLKWIVE